MTQMAFDLVPQSWVASPTFLRFRAAVSTSPQRFRQGPDVESGETWKQIVTPESDLCVEGFPGSGNTQLSFVLRRALGSSYSIQSHLHLLIQLKRALRFGVPIIVLVRHPDGACNSLKSKTPTLLDWLILLRWLQFNRFVYRHRERLEIFLFDEIISDIDIVRRTSLVLKGIVGKPLKPSDCHRNPSRKRYSIGSDRLLAGGLRKRALRLFEEIRSSAWSKRFLRRTLPSRLLTA